MIILLHQVTLWLGNYIIEKGTAGLGPLTLSLSLSHYRQDPDHDSSNDRSYHEDEESPNSSESSFKPKAEARPPCSEKSPRHYHA